MFTTHEERFLPYFHKNFLECALTNCLYFIILQIHLQVSDQKNPLDEQVINAISQLLNYSPTSMNGSLEDLRKTKLSALKIVSDNWDKERMIEFIWAAIKEEPDIEIKKHLVKFIINKRKLKAFPRLLRFCQIGVFTPQIQRLIASRFIAYYEQIDDPSNEEDIRHSFDVLAKTLREKDTQSLPVAVAILSSFETRSEIPSFLEKEMILANFRKLVFGIAKSEYILDKIFSVQNIGEQKENIILELAKILLFRHDKAPSQKVVVDLTDITLWSSYMDLPSPLKFIIARVKSPYSPLKIRLQAIKALSSIQSSVIGLLPEIMLGLPEQDWKIIDEIYIQDIYNSAIQLPAITGAGLRRLFAERYLPQFLLNYDYSNAIQDTVLNVVNLTEYELELIKVLQDIDMAKELPFLDKVDELHKKLDGLNLPKNELKQLKEKLINDDTIKKIQTALNTIEYGLLCVLEHSRLLAKTMEHMKIEEELTYHVILDAFYEESLPEAFNMEPLMPNFLMKFLLLDIVRQTLLSTAFTTTKPDIRQQAFSQLSSPEFWKIEETITVSPAQIQLILDIGINILLYEKNRMVYFAIFKTLYSFLKTLFHEIKNGNSIFPIDDIISRLEQSAIKEKIMSLSTNPQSFPLYLLYTLMVEGTVPQLPPVNKITSDIAAILIDLYLPHLSSATGKDALENLLKHRASKTEFLKAIDEISSDMDNTMTTNLTVIHEFLESLADDQSSEIRTKSRFLLKRLEHYFPIDQKEQ